MLGNNLNKFLWDFVKILFLKNKKKIKSKKTFELNLSEIILNWEGDIK